jgi:hypothetical protein
MPLKKSLNFLFTLEESVATKKRVFVESGYIETANWNTFSTSSTHTVFSVEDVEKVFQFAVSIYPDSTKTLFFLATDSSRVKRKFKDFFKGMTHMTQERKIRHTHLQTHSSLLMNAIDIALLSYGDSLVYTGSSFAEAAHMLQLNPGQKKFKFS